MGATLYVFVQLIGKPDYKTLYSGLNPGDAQEITAALAAKKIPFEQSPDGTSILVPADKLDSARLEVASQPMPHSGRLGFELFDKPNWAGSDFSEKVNYQRALEAELERTLAHLERGGSGSGPPGDAGGVAVQRARPQRQSVGNGQAAPRQSAAAGGHGDTPAGGRSRRPPDPGKRGGRRCRDQSAAESPGRPAPVKATYPRWIRSWRSEWSQTLEPVVGPEGVRASVHVEYDLSSGEETQETYDPSQLPWP